MSADGTAIRFELPVLAGKARELALALGDTSPLYEDDEAARRAGFPGRVAPPTYPMLQAWHVTVEQLQELRRVDYSRALHAEQRFAYRRPLLIGEVLRGEVRLAGVRRHRGRSGGMSFITYRTDLRDGGGGPVAAVDYTLVELDEARPEPGEQRARPEPEPEPPAHSHRIGPIRRLDFARYAGASGDFHPMHVDEAAARAAGEPSVFAAGMMLAGQLASAAVAWSGERAALRSYGVRILARAWPGDRLACEGSPAEEPGALALRLRRLPAEGPAQTAVTGTAAPFPRGGDG